MKAATGSLRNRVRRLERARVERGDDLIVRIRKFSGLPDVVVRVRGPQPVGTIQ